MLAQSAFNLSPRTASGFCNRPLTSPRGRRPVFSHFLRKILPSVLKNFSFHHTPSAEEAAIIAATLKPNLIITEVYFSDYELGEPDKHYAGPWLIRKFREKTPGSKIIVASTQADGCFGDWYVKDLGVAAYFKKPYKLEAVIEKSMELLKLPYGLSAN